MSADSVLAKARAPHDAHRLFRMMVRLTRAGMQALTVRFPDALIEEWAPILFMALVVRLVNDPSAACRDMYEQALKTLLQVRITNSPGQVQLSPQMLYCAEPVAHLVPVSQESGTYPGVCSGT